MNDPQHADLERVLEPLNLDLGPQTLQFNLENPFITEPLNQTVPNIRTQPRVIQRHPANPPMPIFIRSSNSRCVLNNLAGFLLSEISPTLIQNYSDISFFNENYSIVHKNLLDLICRACSMPKGRARLSCTHSVCVGCHKKNLNAFFHNPTISTLKSIRCPECMLLPSEMDIFYFFGNEGDELKKFNTIEIFKQCVWCKRKLNLLNEYLPELRCLHLCRECYIHELFFNVKSCVHCGVTFENVEYTKSRKDSCKICGKIGNIVSECFLSFYNNRVICYQCQQDIIASGDWVKAFGELDIKKGIPLLKYYLNKNCPDCGQTKALADLVICKKCNNFKCDLCYEQKKVCDFCEV